jgi:hypothetical protein
MLKWDVSDIIKNKEIKSLLLQYLIEVKWLLWFLETLHNMSCDEKRIKPSEHLSPFDKRGEDS